MLGFGVCRLRDAGCGLRVAGCGLRVAGCGLRVAGCGFGVDFRIEALNFRMRVGLARPEPNATQGKLRQCLYKMKFKAKGSSARGLTSKSTSRSWMTTVSCTPPDPELIRHL